MSPEGSILTTVDNALVPIKRKTKQPEAQDPAHFAFSGGLIGFPIRTAGGAEASVFVDASTGAVDRIDDPLTFLRVDNGMNKRRLCGGAGEVYDEWGAPDTYWAAMVKVGELPESTGFVDRNIYMPLEERGGR